MTDAPPSEKKPRSKRIYVYWGMPFALLLVLGLFCWLFLLPEQRLRGIVARCAENSEIIPRAIEDMGGPDAAVGELEGYLALSDGRSPHKETAVLMLIHCESAGVSVLAKCLRQRDPGVRVKAAWALGLWRGKAVEALPALERSLNDEAPKVAAEAAWALGQVGDRRAVKPLTIALAQRRESNVRGYIAMALGELGGATAVRALSEALNDRNEWVRRKAREALEKIKAVQEEK